MGNLEWVDGPPDGSRRRSIDRTGPVLIAAFEGWNDAGDAATSAVEHLWEHWGATTVAAIDPEDFYDFTATRPQVRRDPHGRRVLEWPANELGWAEPAGTDGVVLLLGVEPQLRWRTFCETVLGAARDLDCRWILTVGALLADVPHTRPTPVFGTAEDPTLGSRLGLTASDYEGPTGIVGALHSEATAHGVPTASLWAAVPAYAPSVPSPRAALGLVTRTASMLGTDVDTGVLEAAGISYERQLGQLVSEDEATLEYVRLLERRHDAEHLGVDDDSVPNADRLLEEVERFLRDQ